MELNTNVIKNMKDLMEKFKSSDINYELEGRIFNPKKLGNIDYYLFDQMLNKLIVSPNNNGMGYSYQKVSCLDIIMEDKVRITISNLSDIKEYWLKNEIDKKKLKFMKKKNDETINIINYDLRISLSEELEINKKKQDEIYEKLLSRTTSKLYRLKNRYEINTPNKCFRFDFSIVKTSKDNSFKKSDIFNKEPKFEVELECVQNNCRETDFDEFIKYLNILISLYQRNKYIMSNNEKNNILNQYLNIINYNNLNKNFKGNKYDDDYKHVFIAASPVTLHIRNLQKNSNQINILKDYSVTAKADGERNLLFVDNTNTIYLINNNYKVINTQLKSNKVGSIIECELVNDKLILCYDCLFYNNKDIRKSQLKQRLENLDNLIESIDKIDNDIFRIEIKKHYFGEGNIIFENAREIWNNKENLEYVLDGLIFTPIKEHYPPRGGGWQSLFKWKPSELNTIDFMISIEKINNGEDKVSSHIGKINNLTGKPNIINYKTVNLYVTGNEDKFNKFTKKWNKKTVAKLFEPEINIENDLLGNIYHKANIPIEDDDNMYAIDELNKTKDKIIDNTIIEFAYDKSDPYFKWKPLRIRYDKTYKLKSGKKYYGNYEKTANDIWISIKNPVTYEMIFDGKIPEAIEEFETNTGKYYANCMNSDYNSNKRLPFQNFHNLIIKKNLIVDYTPHKLTDSKEIQVGGLLDLACGKSGDISKWKAAKLKTVVGIDIDKGCIDYSIKFYKTVARPKPNVYYVWGDTSNLIFPLYSAGKNDSEKIRLKRYIPNKYAFDTVSCQFCLHYYFKNEITLKTLLQNVNDNLKIDGYFIGTSFDGQRIFDKLKGKKSIKGNIDGDKLFEIKRDYKIRKFDLDKPLLGNEIDVWVKSIGNSHKEYLVNYTYFDQILKEYGFEKVKIESFQDVYDKIVDNDTFKMSDVEKEFSFLNNTFVYKKVAHSPEYLYKNLSDLIAKNNLKKLKEVKKTIISNKNNEKENADNEVKVKVNDNVVIDINDNNNENDIKVIKIKKDVKRI